jgi:hypothetical protein
MSCRRARAASCAPPASSRRPRHARSSDPHAGNVCRNAEHHGVGAVERERARQRHTPLLVLRLQSRAIATPPGRGRRRRARAPALGDVAVSLQRDAQIVSSRAVRASSASSPVVACAPCVVNKVSDANDRDRASLMGAPGIVEVADTRMPNTGRARARTSAFAVVGAQIRNACLGQNNGWTDTHGPVSLGRQAAGRGGEISTTGTATGVAATPMRRSQDLRDAPLRRRAGRSRSARWRCSPGL